jgi:hypothetical protein
LNPLSIQSGNTDHPKTNFSHTFYKQIWTIITLHFSSGVVENHERMLEFVDAVLHGCINEGFLPDVLSAQDGNIVKEATSC